MSDNTFDNSPARHYSAAMDSVNLINDLVAKGSLSDKDKATVDRNVGHLEIVIGWDIWTDEDMKPFEDAIAAGKAVL